MNTKSGTASSVKFVIVPQMRMGRMSKKSGRRKPRADGDPAEEEPGECETEGHRETEEQEGDHADEHERRQNLVEGQLHRSVDLLRRLVGGFPAARTGSRP